MKIRNLLKTTNNIGMADIPIGVVFSGTVCLSGIAKKVSSVFIKGRDAVLDLGCPINTWVINVSDKYATREQYEASNNVVIDYKLLDVELVVNGPCIINTEEEARIYAKDIIT